MAHLRLRFFAVAIGRLVQVWRTPGLHKEFAPFILFREFPKHHDDVTTLDWSYDSRFLVSGSKDTTCQIYALHNIPGYRVFRLVGHRDAVVRAFFAKDSMDVRMLALAV